MDTHAKPGAGFFLTVAAAVALFYAALLGPSCWASSRSGVGASAVSLVYGPLLLVADHCPMPVQQIVHRYAFVWAADGWRWTSEHTWQFRPFVVYLR